MAKLTGFHQGTASRIRMSELAFRSFS